MRLSLDRFLVLTAVHRAGRDRSMSTASKRRGTLKLLRDPIRTTRSPNDLRVRIPCRGIKMHTSNNSFYSSTNLPLLVPRTNLVVLHSPPLRGKLNNNSRLRPHNLKAGSVGLARTNPHSYTDPVLTTEARRTPSACPVPERTTYPILRLN